MQLAGKTVLLLGGRFVQNSTNATTTGSVAVGNSSNTTNATAFVSGNGTCAPDVDTNVAECVWV